MANAPGSIAGSFDVGAARKAGYTDSEIADYLGQQNKFDTPAARQMGYTDAEILDHLTSATPFVRGEGHGTGPEAAKPGLVNDVTGFMANVNRGLMVGDEMAAGARTAGNLIGGKIALSDVPADFRASMTRQRGIEDAYTAEHPHLAALGRGTGTALTMAAPVGPGAEAFAGGNLMTNAARGATVAGVTGAGYAAADRGSPEERVAAATKAARDPVTLALGAGAGALATTGRVKPATPTLEPLTAQKDAAYRGVDESGVRYTPEAFKGLTQDMATALDAAGFHAGLHPKTAAMMERIGASDRGVGGYAPSLGELDQLRQQIGNDIAGSNDPGERRMGTIMRGVIDSFIEKAGPEQVTGGDPAAAAQAIAGARDLNTRVAKMRSLDNLDEAAADRASGTGSGGNINNTTRQNVIRFKNNTGNLTPDERAAAQKVIDGTMVGNAARQVGKLSPAGNGLMTAGHVAALLPTHGASAGIAVAGAVSKVVADAITARNVAALRDLIATGGKTAQEVSVALQDPQYADLRRQLANDLAVQAGVQGASRPSMTGRPPPAARAYSQ